MATKEKNKLGGLILDVPRVKVNHNINTLGAVQGDSFIGPN